MAKAKKVKTAKKPSGAKTVKAKKTVKPIKKAVEKKKVTKKPALKKSALKKTVIKKASAKKPAAKKPEVKKVPPRKIKKRSGKQKMRYTTAELNDFRKILLEERRQILESARANMKSLVDDESGDYVGENLTYASHMAEQGTDEMEREKNYMFVQRDEKYLGYIQEALLRIDIGTYGVCIDCLEEPKDICNTCPLIPKERLELVPITQHCIECKNIRG